MIEPLTGRRRFLLAALAGLGRARVVWARETPIPRVARLEDWRASPGLAGLKEAFEYLRSTPLGEKAPGRYPIDGDRMYLVIARDKTRAPETGRFEAHRK